MAGKAFTGASLTFNASDVGEIKSMSWSEDGNVVDVTSIDDAVHTFDAGIPSQELTIVVAGQTSLSVGDSGAAAITWYSGATDSIGTGRVSSISTDGELDGEVTSTVVIVPSV